MFQYQVEARHYKLVAGLFLLIVLAVMAVVT